MRILGVNRKPIGVSSEAVIFGMFGVVTRPHAQKRSNLLDGLSEPVRAIFVSFKASGTLQAVKDM